MQSGRGRFRREELSPSPSAIVPGFLYLGDAFDATSAATLRALGIRRVVNCAGGDRDRRIITDDEGMTRYSDSQIM